MPSRHQTKRFLKLQMPAAIALLCLAGCEKESKPDGQVVASIDGEDITQRDLQSELMAAGGARGQLTPAQRSAVLEQVINRKLLALEAKKVRLDKSPEYLAAVQRMKDVILDSMLVNQRMQQFPTPAPAEVQQFINDNPQMFADRKIFLLDQIVTSASDLDRAMLSKLGSNDAIAKQLTSMNHKFERRRNKFDAVTLPKEMVAKLESLPKGEPFIVSKGGQILINSKIDMVAAPIAVKEQQQAAANILKKQNVEKALEEQVDYRRKAVKIEYRKGYEPPAESKKAD